MSEISKNKRKKLLTNEKSRIDIYEKIKNNNNIINFFSYKYIIKEDKNQKILKNTKYKNSIQSKLVIKIHFLFKLLIFINLYFHMFSTVRVIKIETKLMELKEKYKILTYKNSHAPSKINIDNGDDISFSDINDPIFKDDNSIFYRPSNLPESKIFKFTWNQEVTSFKELFKNCDIIKSIDFENYSETGKVTNMESMFDGCTNLIILHISKFQTYNVVNMKSMFKSCVNLESLDVSKFETSKVTNMEKMFSNCQSVKSLDISHFEVSSVTTMRSMFEYCSSLTSLMLYEFMTISVTDMSFMFYECSNLISIDVSSFKIKKVSDMSFMFYGCKSLTSATLFTTLSSNAINMNSVFHGCSSLQILNLYKSNTLPVNNMNKMFYNCNSLTYLNLTRFKTKNVRDMKSMFYGCSSLKSLYINNFNTELLEDMGYMFAKCSSLTSLDLTNFSTKKVRNMKYMFYGCSSLASLYINSTDFDTSNVYNMEYMFYNCSSLKSIDISKLRTTNVLNMGHMFFNCSSLNPLDIQHFDTSKVTNMEYMFSGCSSIESFNLTNFNTTKVNNMQSMFQGCSSLNSLIIDSSKFETNSVTNMNSMFSGCSKMAQIDIKHFDTSQVTDMDYMFNGTSSLSSLNLSSLLTSNVRSMKNMFSYCSSLTSIDISKFDTSKVTNMMSLFSGCDKLRFITLGEINISNVKNMNSMFRGCKILSSLDLTNFKAENVIDMGHMFSGCSSLEEINLTKFIYNFVQSISMDYMFSGCLLVTSIKFPNKGIIVNNLTHIFSECYSLKNLDLSQLDTSSVVNMDYMFNGCSHLTNLALQNFVTSSVTTMEHMFSGCTSLLNLDISSFDTKLVKFMNGMFYGCHLLISLDVTKFNTDNVIDMAFMFYKLESVTSLDVSKFNTTNVDYMYHMFEGCKSLKSLSLTNFDISNLKSLDNLFSGCSSLTSLDISKLNTSKIESMNYLFNGCRKLPTLDLSNFNTENVVSMNYMFAGCQSLANFIFYKFNTSKVTSMEYLFHECSELTSLNLDALHFDTSKVTKMGHMFSGCSKLFTLNISIFDTSQVISMEYMFADCKSIEELIISNFNTSNVEDFSHMFDNCENLLSINLANFDIKNGATMDYMFNNCKDLGYVNLIQLNESIINTKPVNIFPETPGNMVFCFKESNIKLKKVVDFKSCSFINCTGNWFEIRRNISSITDECIGECKKLTRFFYRHRCYPRCPDDTFPYNFRCSKDKDRYKGEGNCTIKKYFSSNCTIFLSNNTEKHKFIINITEEIMNAELYDIILDVLDKKKEYIRREENEIYQLYSLSSKERRPDLTYIDLDECGRLLKEKYKLKNDEEILVFKIEFTSPDFKIPIVEYLLFGRDGAIKLNLNICNKLKVMHYIPKIINFTDYQYNPGNSFYFDKCRPIGIESDSDLTLYDRRNDYNINNMSLCESHCTFKGYSEGQIKCECDIKIKFNSYLNNIDPYNYVHRFHDLDESHVNIWVMKCILLIFKKGVLNQNYGHYILLSVIFIIIVGALIFYLLEYNILLNKIKYLFQETSDKINKKSHKKSSKEDKKETLNPSSIYDDNKKNKLIIKKNQINSSDLVSKDKININNNIPLDSNFDLNNLYIEGNNEIYSKKTDNEMNYLRYESAIKSDKRTYFECYLSLIRTKQLLIFTLYPSNDFNSRVIKICYVFFIYPLFLTINALFIEDSTMHYLYIYSDSVNYMDHLFKIIYATVICFILSKLLEKFIFTEMSILQIKKNDGKDREQKLRKVYFLVSVKCVLFFALSLIFLFIDWIYISTFCYVFKRTQKFLIIISSMSLGAFLVIPFILNIIPPIFRKIALQKYDESTKRFYLYKLSQILQIVL